MYDALPIIQYPVKLSTKTLYKLLGDISVNLKVQEDLVNGYSYFEYYMISDGETPESIAYKYYGNTKYHYLVMLANSRYDLTNDWPLGQVELENYINDVYKSPEDVHHYINTNTNLEISKDDEELNKYIEEHEGELPEYINAINNIEYEYELNEEKRKIKLIKKELADNLDTVLRNLIS